MNTLLIKILDYDWLKDNRKFSEPKISPKSDEENFDKEL